jgi:alpha-1,6-mannosyltransferase
VAPAVAAFGLNPVLLVWTVGGAHNDVLMLLGLAAGVALVLARHEIAGGAALVAAVAVKASAGLALPFVVLGAQRRLRVLGGVAAAGIVVAAVSYAAFPDHALTMLTTLRRQQLLQGFGAEPVEVAQWLGLPAVPPEWLLVLKASRVAAALAALAWVVRGGDGPTAAGWVLLAVVATSTWELGWYTVWPLAFAAVSPSRRLLVATCGLQLAYAVTHLPLG